MLLLSIHQFFMGLGVDEIRRRGQEDDKPLRMVKTVLHEARLPALLLTLSTVS
jgi:cytoskeleton-associated protein 5